MFPNDESGLREIFTEELQKYSIEHKDDFNFLEFIETFETVK